MEYQYKLILTNRRICKEFIITNNMSEVMLGTTADCIFRINQEYFFEKVQVSFQKKDGVWQAICNDGLYFNVGDSRKLMVVELRHGDIVTLHYSESGNELFQLRFSIDFDYKTPFYNWYIDLRNTSGVNIGDAENNNLVILNPLEKNVSISVVEENGSYIIRNKHSIYGVYINGKAVNDYQILSDYEFISLAGVSFYFKDAILFFDINDVRVNGIEVNMVQKKNKFLYPKFIRNTRRKKKTIEGNIKILDPRQKPTKPELNIVTSLMPSIAMFALVVVLRGFMSTTGGTYVLFSICSMGLGLITTIVSLIQSQKKYKKDIKERTDTYNSYIEKKKEEIIVARKEERELLNDMYFGVNKGIEKIKNFDSDIFDRIPTDDDFLYVYLGQGKAKAKRKIEYKEQEKLVDDDELANLPIALADKYEFIDEMPITVDLKSANAIGVVGDAQNRVNLFRNMICDITARQYHTDVKMYVLLKDEIEETKWLKLLPQINDENFNRNIVFDDTSKTNVFENLFKELTFRSENEGNFTHLIVFALNNHGITSHPISKFVPNAAAINTTFVFFEDSVDFLPLHCSAIVECKDVSQGEIYKTENEVERQLFSYDSLSFENMMEMAQKLAAIYCEEISLESTLRKNISMFEMLEIYAASDLDLLKRWNSSRIYETMAVPLGVNSKEEIVYLNLHEKFHGPHGLVAGTTGSGKSEILQSYILSAATLFHPYEIGFVIIDFKGGGMVNQFSKLPHLIGAITNIDGKEIDRSLKSIKAELIKRQELFAQANVNHIDKYIKAFKEGRVNIALPHLIIIVDEFAELKAEQPEFMKELISAARIGRSLGVHLILATQKPAGQVNEQIWSNSKFKLCLKVQDQEDSKEVIKSPLAAEIKEPGRAYLQVGNNEIFELFQSAYSGGPAVREEESSSKKFKIFNMGIGGRQSILFETKRVENKKDSISELEAIVEYISDYCEKNNIEKLQNICLQSLPDVINYVSISSDYDKLMQIAIGKYDDPDHQYQGEYYSNIGLENTIIIGASQTGKTNLLQLCIRQLTMFNSPEKLSLYILDFGSMVLKNFEGLKHIGGIVLASEDEKIKNFFRLMVNEIEIRKNKLMKAGVSSFGAYNEAGFNDLPKIYMLIDNFNAFKELYLEKYEQDFVRLCRDGISLGISVIITNASTTGIGYRHLSNFSNRLCLSCNDKTDYSSMLDRCRMEPKNVPGRLLFQQDKVIYEAQSYLAFEGEKEIDRAKAMRSFVNNINEKYFDYTGARQIPEIPTVLEWDVFRNQYMENIEKHSLPIGLDYASIEPISINLTDDAEISIVSKKRQNSNELTKRIINIITKNCFTMQFNMFIIDSVERGLQEYKENPFVVSYSLDASESEIMIDAMINLLENNKQKIIANGVQSDISYNILVLNSKDALDYISTTKPVLEKFKEMIESYKNYGLLVIYGNVDNVTIPYSAPELLKRIKDNRKAIIGDALNTVKIFDIPSGVAISYDKPLMQDEAYIVMGPDLNKVKFIS